jgi:hypothetical protein
MFPRDRQVVAFNNTKLENLERCAEIMMQAQYAADRKIGSNSNETFSHRGAAQCRESSARTALSANPTCNQPQIQFEARSFCGRISARVCNVLFCKVALRVRPSSPGGFAGLGVEATSDL